MKKSRTIPPLILFLIITFLIIVIFSMFASVFFPIDLGETNLTNRLLPPSFVEGGSEEYFLGTDHIGRDFGVRLVYAMRNSIIIAFSAMLISSIIGTILGVLSGLFGGWVDTVVLFLVDAKLSIPNIIIAIVCASIFGTSKINMILIIGFTGWGTFARLVRGQIIQLKQQNFIECSKALGSSKLRILFEHIFVNVASPLIVHATMRLSSFILVESSLSFLGLGIQPPDVSLGVMVSVGRDYLISSWWLTIVPSIVIIILVLQVSLVGDWLRDRLDPKLQNN